MDYNPVTHFSWIPLIFSFTSTLPQNIKKDWFLGNQPVGLGIKPPHFRSAAFKVRTMISDDSF